MILCEIMIVLIGIGVYPYKNTINLFKIYGLLNKINRYLVKNYNSLLSYFEIVNWRSVNI